MTRKWPQQPWNVHEILTKFKRNSYQFWERIAFLKNLLDYALKICVTILITALGWFIFFFVWNVVYPFGISFHPCSTKKIWFLTLCFDFCPVEAKINKKVWILLVSSHKTSKDWKIRSNYSQMLYSIPTIILILSGYSH